MNALDASALLALLYREPGHQLVAARVASSCISSVNLAEVLSCFARDGHDPARVRERLLASPIEIVSFGPREAAAVAALVPATRKLGLSLGDRSCLALAMARGVPALTADRAWRDLDLEVEVEIVR